MEQKYSVIVDYSHKIKSYLYEKSGIISINDVIVEKTITRRSGTKTIEIFIIHFEPMKTNEEIFSKLEILGMRQTETHELIALGVQYPELAKYWVTTLGSEYPNRSFPHLQPGLVVGLRYPYDPMHSHLFDVATRKWKLDLWIAAVKKEKQSIA